MFTGIDSWPTRTLETHMPGMLDVNNGLYNALIQGLGLSPQSFQMIQPSPPLLPNNDAYLWNYFNHIPPVSLTQNYVASGGNQFFSDYMGFMSALTSVVRNRFVQDVGQNVADKFMDYLATRSTPPSLNQYPAIFRSWAFLRYPTVANRGASDLAAALLDPVASAQLAIAAYQGDPGADPPIPARQPDWDLGYSQLLTLLRQAPSRAFTYRKSTAIIDVSHTWSHGSNFGFFGLWGGSSSSSSQSVTFASNDIQIDASFGHLLSFAATPGQWYSSAATGLAYSHKTGAPWDGSSPINWNNTFDSNTGNMARFMVNLVVVDTLRISVKSFATFSQSDQTVIHNNSGGGLWPFYVTNSSSGASQSVSFDDRGAMTITTASLPGVPIVIGGDVLPVDQFVGHAISGHKLFAELLHENREMRSILEAAA
jgi:hypothetical protein